MKTYTVLLSDGTILAVNSATPIEIGHHMIGKSYEPDGAFIEKTETVTDILDVTECDLSLTDSR